MFEGIGTAIEFLAYGITVLGLVGGCLVLWKFKTMLFREKE